MILYTIPITILIEDNVTYIHKANINRSTQMTNSRLKKEEE